MSPTSRGRSRLATRAARYLLPRLAVSILGVLLVLVLAEIVVRTFDFWPTFSVVYRDMFRHSENQRLRYELQPGAPDGRHAINRAGFRDRDYERQKPDDGFRIAVIGDSIAYGYGLDRDQTFPEQLEVLLGECAGVDAPRFEVLNFGITGYNISQSVERLRVLGMAYRPDLVIYAYSLNDPQAFSYEAESLESLRRGSRDPHHDAYRGALRLLSHSRFFLVARHALTPAGEKQAPALVPGFGPDWTALLSGDDRLEYFRSLHSHDPGARRLAEGMDALAALVQESGGAALVLTFPLFVESLGPRYPLADVHELVAAAARRGGLAALDLRPVYAGARLRFGGGVAYDLMHPDALGHRIAAAALLRWLRDSSLLGAGSLETNCLSARGGQEAAIAALLDWALGPSGE